MTKQSFNNFERDQELNRLALQASNNSEAMKQLRESLVPLVNHVVDHYIAQYQESNENMENINKEKLDIVRSRLMEAAWSALPKSLDLFNSQSKDDKYKFGTFFSYLTRNEVIKELES